MMFFIYSFIGWIVEVVYYGITEGQFINRGFLNGPLCPVYGLAFYTALWFFEPLKTNVAVIFFGAAGACTFVELIAGVILYHIFHLRWWDYTNYKFNFRGFICLRFFIYWGIAGTLGMYALHPAVLKVIGWMNFPVKLTILSIFSLIMVVDLIASVANIIGFASKLETFNKFSATVKTASDYIGGNIYGTVDTIMEVEGPIKDSYDAYRKLVNDNKAEENELARRHRAEEREYLKAFMASGKDAAFKTKDIASEKMFGLVDSFNIFEKRLLRTVDIGGMHNVYDRAIKTIKDTYYKATANKDPSKMVAEDPNKIDIIAEEVAVSENTGSI